MDDARPPATPRRDFLRAIALAPALAAGCAGARASAPGSSSKDPVGTNATATPAPPAGPDPLAPLRAFPLSADAEPAFVFRAAPARPGA